MTREEEIKQASELAYHYSNGVFTDGMRECFVKGAEWVDQHPREGLWDSEKVCKFINENVREYHKSGVFHIGDFIKDLRKAMEES